LFCAKQDCHFGDVHHLKDEAEKSSLVK